MTWTILCDGADGPKVVGTFDEIETVIKRAIQYSQAEYGRPTLVELSRENHSTMAIVVGGTRSFVAFLIAPHGPGFHAHPRTTPSPEIPDPFLYIQFGSLSEANLADTISSEEAIEALHLYFATGERPETLDWGD